MANTEIRSRQIGKDKAHVVHLRDRHEEVPERRGRHDTQVSIPDRHRDGVFQIGRKLVKEKHERVTAKQLLPGLGSRCIEERGNVAGELLRFAEVFCDRAPDSPCCIGASSIEADNTTAAEIRSWVLRAENFFSQLGITRQ